MEFVECSKEMGEWTIRINGRFVYSFRKTGLLWMNDHKAEAFEMAYRLRRALNSFECAKGDPQDEDAS